MTTQGQPEPNPRSVTITEARDWMRAMSQVAPPCQIGAHESCDEMTASFNAENAAEFVCRCRCHATQGQETALDLDKLCYNLPAHYFDCDRFNVDHSFRQGKCDCAATADFHHLIAEVERLRSERDSWARRFASVEKELDEKTEAVREILIDAAHPPYTSDTDERCRIYARAILDAAQLLAGPSSVADYEALGTPVKERCQAEVHPGSGPRRCFFAAKPGERFCSTHLRKARRLSADQEGGQK